VPPPETGGPVLTREIREGLPAGVLVVPEPPLPVLPEPWRARLLQPGSQDAQLLGRWMSEPHVEKFWEQNWPAERWDRHLRAQLSGAYSRPLLVLFEGVPFAYVEIYRAARDVLGQVYPADAHDLGVHLAIGELSFTGKGLGRKMMRALVEALFVADPACERVVAEPDARNDPARKMFTAAGFRLQAEVRLPHKPAALMVATP
jgi:RimJ/RimL family protein N-acetyltransferase